MDSKVYIGDGVYVTFDDPYEGSLTLTTENGVRVTNIIILEPREWDSLKKIVEVRRSGKIRRGAD